MITTIAVEWLLLALTSWWLRVMHNDNWGMCVVLAVGLHSTVAFAVFVLMPWLTASTRILSPL